MHGGASPGAPSGKSNGNYKTGAFSREFVDARRLLWALVRLTRQGDR
jgi:hypothetical protein